MKKMKLLVLCGITICMIFGCGEKKDQGEQSPKEEIIQEELFTDQEENIVEDIDAAEELQSIDLNARWKEFLENTGENEKYFLVEDYDEDGQEEAFGITGEFDADDMGSDVKIYYIDKEGDIFSVREYTDYGDHLYGFLRTHWLGENQVTYTLSANHSKFIVWEISAGGSGSESLIFGVRDGSVYEPLVSGKYQYFSYDQNARVFRGDTSDFSTGSHEYISHTFTFDPESGEFIDEMESY